VENTNRIRQAARNLRGLFVQNDVSVSAADWGVQRRTDNLRDQQSCCNTAKSVSPLLNSGSEPMAIAIDSETESFAVRLARLRGQTVEQAVGAAIRAELARIERSTPDTLTAEQAALVERTMAKLEKLPAFDIDRTDPTGFLYDEHGLPTWTMIADSSAVIAILHREPEARNFLRALSVAPICRISAATYLETGVVLVRREPTGMAREALDTLIVDHGIVIEPVTREQARIALDAFGRFGKGSGHPASLNYGDCFSYALAKDTGEPLLFKGNDFSQTDLVPAGWQR
jgi:ribonuclease VapC